VQMVSAFRCLKQMFNPKHGSGTVLSWSQQKARLLAAGDSRTIMEWDADRELCVREIDSMAQYPVTAMSSPALAPSVFAASYGDGALRLFDLRARPEDVLLRTYRDHQVWVENVRWKHGMDHELLSASLDGEIRMWDIRGSNVSVDDWTLHPGGLAAFDMHRHTGVFAASSAITSANWRTQLTTVHASPPIARVLSRFAVPTGLTHSPSRTLPSAVIQSRTSLAFHPNEMLLGTSGIDGVIKVMGCNLEDTQLDTSKYYAPLDHLHHLAV